MNPQVFVTQTIAAKTPLLEKLAYCWSLIERSICMDPYFETVNRLTNVIESALSNTSTCQRCFVLLLWFNLQIYVQMNTHIMNASQTMSSSDWEIRNLRKKQ